MDTAKAFWFSLKNVGHCIFCSINAETYQILDESAKEASNFITLQCLSELKVLGAKDASKVVHFLVT